MWCIFLAVLNPEVNVFSLFKYNIIFQRYQYFEPPSSTTGGEGEIDKCARKLFCTKLNPEQLLFEPFFDVMRIFGRIEP